jgi:hypothetical protein
MNGLHKLEIGLLLSVNVILFVHYTYTHFKTKIKSLVLHPIKAYKYSYRALFLLNLLLFFLK